MNSLMGSMPICGQAPFAAIGPFLGMWVLMMAAMMLPSLTPMLLQYREAAGRAGDARLVCSTAWVGGGYFLVWGAAGLIAWPLSVLLTHASPLASGVVALGAGAFQFTTLKARHLMACRRRVGQTDVPAWRHGLKLGFHCACSCAGLTVALLAFGTMDLKAMILMTGAITAERLAPAGRLVARATGALVIAAGLALTLRAV